MEEKGEKFRAGEKAQRFYERSLELYRLAYSMEGTFDAAYNQCVVKFLGHCSSLSPNGYVCLNPR